MERSSPSGSVSVSSGAVQRAEPYSVKRHGTTIDSCDSEPVQTPGCIQAHGVLLVVRPSDLAVVQVSENVEAILGVAVDALLGWPLGVAIGADCEAYVRQFLDRPTVPNSPLYVVTMPARPGAAALDVTVHVLDGVAIVELEATGRSDGTEPDYFGLLKKSVARLHDVASVASLAQIITEEVRTITGFDRVMVYKFHADGHGEVFAESRRDTCAPWLGMHYPAEDIPKPARDVFMQVWCRPMPDVAGDLAELVPLVHPVTQRPLLMTHCALRGPSIMYTEYLHNMGVTAGLTMPLRHGGELWGLIACHHYTAPRSAPYPVRAACEFLAQIASLQLNVAEEREHMIYRLRLESVHNDLVAQAAQEDGFARLLDGRPGMLEGLKAGGGALYHRGRWWKVGQTPTDPQLDGLAAWLETRPEFEPTTRSVYASDSLAKDYAPAADFSDVASGLLAFGLTRGPRNAMMWFRPETLQTIHWAGNPADKPTTLGPSGPRLTPRASFELFRESVRGFAKPWLSVEIEAAARLRVLLMELVVGRAAELSELNNDLTRSNEELDAFAYAASHDLKEPLRGINKYAHQLLLEANLDDQEQRRRLNGLMRMTLRMDSLLDSLLHFSRVGRVALELEPTDLNELLSEALEMVGSRTLDPKVEVVVPRPLPRLRCDRVRTREIFVNLLSNALKYNDKHDKRIEVGYVEPGGDAPPPGTPPDAVRHTIFVVKDNGIGISTKHFGHVFKMFRRLHGREEFGGGTGAGLSIVQKLVERHEGQVWIDSLPGAGSSFYFTLPAGEAS